MHVLFSTIYLLHEAQLNFRTYFGREKNVINFVYINYHGVHKYAKIQCVKLYIFLWINTLSFNFLEFYTDK
jgi:hypothetical protein